ncbi:hypothetical protein Nepgr_027813 [Nepenthes gracilis]|uniref:Uncharacterized protein n=1 Tax=Nepenthes gracilis TaxID=150966 RepID=A0AAD3T970_NEPGR|nr:hypothetical protein Nepgr_027813 [Nepenthes gracilis]
MFGDGPLPRPGMSKVGPTVSPRGAFARCTGLQSSGAPLLPHANMQPFKGAIGIRCSIGKDSQSGNRLYINGLPVFQLMVIWWCTLLGACRAFCAAIN